MSSRRVRRWLRRASGVSAIARIATAVIGLWLVGISQAAAQPTAAFADKTLTILVGFQAGGTIDNFARALAPFLRQHLPGHPNVVVQSMPGAGGLIASNYVFEKARADGLTVSFGSWDPLAQALGSPGVRARYDQFAFVGGIDDIRVVYARVDAIPGGIRRPADIMQADGIAIGALNTTSISTLMAQLALKVLGVKDRIISGYRGGNDIFLALQRGEVQFHNTSIGTFRSRGADLVRSGQGIGVAYLTPVDAGGGFERQPLITEMPAFPDLYREIHGRMPSGPDWEALNWLTLLFGEVTFIALAPPATPQPVLAALRAGFAAAVADPEFAERATKANGFPHRAIDAQRGAAVLASVASVAPAVVDAVRNAIAATAKP